MKIDIVRDFRNNILMKEDEWDKNRHANWSLICQQFYDLCKKHQIPYMFYEEAVSEIKDTGGYDSFTYAILMKIFDEVESRLRFMAFL